VKDEGADSEVSVAILANMFFAYETHLDFYGESQVFSTVYSVYCFNKMPL